MVRKSITKKPVVIALLIIQVIPLIIFPLNTFSPTSQVWWLPVLLMGMVIAADIELLFQRQDVMWPWYLIAFAQGFNIISRLMMAFPHATVYNSTGNLVLNSGYLIITVIAMIWSAVYLWYLELPEIRMVMLRV